MPIKKTVCIILVAIICTAGNVANASLRIPLFLANHPGKSIGTVRADDTIYGLLLTPKLQHLTPGVHGFHIHEFPFCAHHAAAAGGHLDLSDVRQHRGPYAGNSHSGDLPLLIVDAQGKAVTPVLAPRLTLSQIKGRALVIHEGGDNYADLPIKNGGGGRRIACGEVPYY